MKASFPKTEKLKSKKGIEYLFLKGKRIQHFPIQFLYAPLPTAKSEVLLQVGFSVPKRRFSLAVDRNRLKRLMRELYRKHKNQFENHLQEPHIAMFIYMGANEMSYQYLEKKIAKVVVDFQHIIKLKKSINEE